MKNKKILVLIPDGVGLRNFAYSDFNQVGETADFSIKYWNFTEFSLAKLGFSEIRNTNVQLHPLTDIYKNARKIIELKNNRQKTNDTVYLDYLFPLSYRNLKSSVKSIATNLMVKRYRNDKGLSEIVRVINANERKTPYYNDCIELLRKENPAMLFCTNQRHTTSIAPLLAATELGIPTATFIFSWDNLPKATMVVETDYYFVWSELMKEQLLFYYPGIKANQIRVTGTPQFEFHYNSDAILSKSDFFAQHGLDGDKKYICFSGDDITTSPYDQLYLRDTAIAVQKLNQQGHNLGVIFRRCPVDFSKRYDAVLREFSDVITPIKPHWEALGTVWNTVIPLPSDVTLLSNVVAHCELVINLGSSMVFDFASMGKPCGYLNYNKGSETGDWNIRKCYNYIHFRSMPSKNCVTWLNGADEIAPSIERMLTDNKEQIKAAQQWFEIINVPPADNASERIWQNISQILKSHHA